MIAALFGRRIDPEGAAERRFPLEHERMVRERLRQVLVAEQAECLICSAACGADLLALDVAGELHLRRRIILPYAREQFRASSVTDRPGNWGPLFDTTCDEVAAHHDLIVLEAAESRSEGHLRVTRTILDDALALARPAERQYTDPREQVCALVVWDGQARGSDDHTAEFARQAQERGVRVIEILTL